jgi:hypothetical protein
MKDIYHNEALFFSRQSGIFERFANALAEINKSAEEILNEPDGEDPSNEDESTVDIDNEEIKNDE